MRRYDTSWPDEPEAIVSERIEAMAHDLERIALSLEGENPEGGPLERIDEHERRQADALERIADVLEGDAGPKLFGVNSR